MARIKDMMQKMMRRFDAADENMKEMRNDLSGIGQKVNAHAVSIKHLEQQMTQLSTIVNVNLALFLATPSKIQRMMVIVWQLLLEGVSKPLIHLCRLWWKLRLEKKMM